MQRHHFIFDAKDERSSSCFRAWLWWCSRALLSPFQLSQCKFLSSTLQLFVTRTLFLGQLAILNLLLSSSEAQKPYLGMLQLVAVSTSPTKFRLISSLHQICAPTAVNAGSPCVDSNHSRPFSFSFSFVCTINASPQLICCPKHDLTSGLFPSRLFDTLIFVIRSWISARTATFTVFSTEVKWNMACSLSVCILPFQRSSHSSSTLRNWHHAPAAPAAEDIYCRSWKWTFVA